ncbi:MAG: DUF5113 domain-containing protein [Bacteroidaceae bacterium]|nr:DUF5113 domain-containing protein [Bacteroidaceae bacterium]
MSLFSCVDIVPTHEIHTIDSLNDIAYGDRYRNIDSSRIAAQQAYDMVRFYKSGKAEACNNLGFCAFMQMKFDLAESLHKQVYRLTKNELELLIADVGLMKIYQRTAMNKEFYDYRNSAMRRMKRISEGADVFTNIHDKVRMKFAFTEFYIVSAVYYYYLHQRVEAVKSLNEISYNDTLTADTGQLLYYLYVRGSSKLNVINEQESQQLSDFDQLFHVWQMSRKGKYLYFEANSLRSIADIITDQAYYRLLQSKRLEDIQQFGYPIDSLLPFRLAGRSLQKFRKSNDLYQIAETYVTIGAYLNVHGCYSQALDTLHNALACVNHYHIMNYGDAKGPGDLLRSDPKGDTIYTGVPWIKQKNVKTVPEWISGISEQLSITYAGLNMKRASDYNRNVYLDMLNYTRQDKELESRYASLQAQSNQLSIIIFVVVGGVILVFVLFAIFSDRSRRRSQTEMKRLRQILLLCRDITSSIPMNIPDIQKKLDNLQGEGVFLLKRNEDKKVVIQPLRQLNREEKGFVRLLQPYVDWAVDNEHSITSLVGEHDRLDEQRYIHERHIYNNVRENLIKKSCLAIVNGINPYIDRILNESHKLLDKDFINNDKIRKEKFQYIEELVTTINEYNDILALWIKMKQGTLNLNIATFDLAQLFELIAKGHQAFEMKKQTLRVEPTTAIVKADRALTLFMINTLAENARKYTPEGGTVRIYAATTEHYVEISVADNGCGLSTEDVARIEGEKVYDSRMIGMKTLGDKVSESLKANKGSGFGLMNCKGIIEKYRKTNALFDVCTFRVESMLGKGSRFYFRLPVGVRRTLKLLLLLFLPFGFQACTGNKYTPPASGESRIFTHTDTVYNKLLNEASNYANSAYFSNVDMRYKDALHYIDTAIVLLNIHHEKYTGHVSPAMQLCGDGIPAEITWWNNNFDTDYYVILDLRNEAAVAFLALKQLNGYQYNNTAFTDIYKLQSEDHSLATYCNQLKRSTTNKMVGLTICVILFLTFLIGYYLLYLRKRIENRINMNQVFEINKKIYAATLSQVHQDEEALQLEENALRQIPRRIVNAAFDPVNEMFVIDHIGIAVYDESSRQLSYTSNPDGEMPEQVRQSFDKNEYVCDRRYQALPLVVESDGASQKIGVLCIERHEDFTANDSDRLLLEMIARYVAIVVINAAVRMAVKYRDIESAHEEAERVSIEDNNLHVQNMVLDNCLSSIKHETVYYPNKIKQIIGLLNTQALPIEEEKNKMKSIIELIEYYRGIFTILSSCAGGQLEQVTFKRMIIPVSEPLDYACSYFKKKCRSDSITLQVTDVQKDEKVIGDVNQLHILFENLIDEALEHPVAGELLLQAVADGQFVRFSFTDTRRSKTVDELNQLFYPNPMLMIAGDEGRLSGTGYLVCKQIIREHDEYVGRRGCRIIAEPATAHHPEATKEEKGFTVYFTIPRK